MKVLTEGMTVECITVPQQDYDELTAERDRYKKALEWVRENVMIATCYEFTVTVNEALEPTVVCDSCHGPLGDDAPLYEDADICRNCHDQVQEAEMTELASMLQYKEAK